MKVENLDVLRPDKVIVQIGGKDIDVSFIPCAITFDIDLLMQELTMLDINKLKGSKDLIKEAKNDIELIKNIRKESNDEIKKAFDLSIKLCATFCEHKYPELDEEWFRNNTDAGRIKLFSDCIKDALSRAYAGIESNSKNSKAPKKSKNQ